MQAGRGGGGGPVASSPAVPGSGGRGRGRYMKGRLPEGVDFAAYPGRSSTPLPTAESKGAERINQLKIWNEAATNDDKRRLHSAQGKAGLAAAGSGSRRTDSFKDAKERHSASFQSSAPDGSSGNVGGDSNDPNASPGASIPPASTDQGSVHSPGSRSVPSSSVHGPGGAKADIYADRSDSESDEGANDYQGAPGKSSSVNGTTSASAQPVAAASQNQKDISSGVAVSASRGAGDQEHVAPASAKTKADAVLAGATPGTQPAKESKGGCCVIQ